MEVSRFGAGNSERVTPDLSSEVSVRFPRPFFQPGMVMQVRFP